MATIIQVKNYRILNMSDMKRIEKEEVISGAAEG